MIRCNVAFTGLDSTENPYPGLSVLRSIKDSGEFTGKIISLTYDSLCTGIYQHELIDEVYLIPFPSEPEEFLFSRLAEINQKTRINCIIPCLDSEIVTYARLSQRLGAIGINVLVPKEDAVKARSKLFLKEFCERNKIDYPASFVISDPHQIDSHATTLHYPLLLKGSIIDAVKVNNSAEAHVFFNRLATEWGLPLIIQENIDGEEYDLAVLADRKSNIVAKVAMKKIGISSRGKAFAGVTVESKEFDALAEKVVKELQWQGPLELELMKNTNLNKIYILEINARFPTWIYTSRGANLNLPMVNLKLALGQELPYLPAYRKGVMFARIVEDSFCNLNCLAQLNLNGEINWVKSRAVSVGG
jgi:carbamoyl-phosphate synthase large subunit